MTIFFKLILLIYFPPLVLSLSKDILERSKRSFNKFRTSAGKNKFKTSKNNTLYFVIMLYPSHLFCMEPMDSAGRQAIIYAPWREIYVNAHNPYQKSDVYKPCTFCTIISNK